MDTQRVKPQVLKQPFERNVNRKDGLILQVHHTVPSATGDIRRSRFLLAAFSPCDEFLAVADHRGSVFVIDLANNLFWHLQKLVSVCVLVFHSHRRDELFVGHSGCHLSLFNSGSGAQVGELSGHSETPFQISFSSGGDFGLSVAQCEGFIWDLRNLTQAHRLNLQPGMSIKKALFMPMSDNIMACFQDDAIHVWAFDTFQCIKQIVPDTWKGNSIKSIAFTRNGRAMVVGGLSKQLVIFVVDDWSTQKTLMLPDSVTCVQHIEFVPDAFDGGANKILAVLTETRSLIFIDVASGSLLSVEVPGSIYSFSCSRAGKYIACNMLSGVVKIFSSTKLIKSLGGEPTHQKQTTQISQHSHLDEIPLASAGNTKVHRAKKHRSHKERLSSFDNFSKTTLNLSRLRPILLEFLEYPEQYRSLIWKSILQLPENREPWQSLVKRPLHPSAINISKNHAIQNKTSLSCLESVVSCLAYWSPVFGEIPYLPNFIFPFVKIFHSDKFVCFEAVATIIVNWCQHWFEYLSFPPVNVLGMIENILSEHDSGLLSLFSKCGITSRCYAWSLLSSAFSEVLPAGHWQQLWDHILSNPPWFLLFAVVAYNMCCRTSLKTCTSKEDFEFFFHHQNPINMKQFLKKCYDLSEKTSAENHPKQYLSDFKPLTHGNYPVFSAYPKYIINYQKEQRDAIRQEEEKILKEQHDIVSQSLAREELRLRENRARMHEARLLEAEKAARSALEVEERRVAEQKKQLMSLQKDLRSQERDSIAKTRVEIMEHDIKQRCAELDRLHNELHCKTEQSAINAQTVNAELQDHYNRLAASKQELEQRLNHYQLNHSAQALADSELHDSSLSELKRQQQNLEKTVQETFKERLFLSTNDKPEVETRLAELDSLKHRVEIALARKAQQQQETIFEAEHCIQDTEKKVMLEKLSLEVEQLMERLKATVLRNGVYSRKFGKDNSPLEFTSSRFAQPNDPIPQSRSSQLYEKERSAVSNAMELRKTLLSHSSLK